MRTKEEILKDIESQKQDIEIEKKFNENSGELSFLYWQLGQLESELEECEKHNS